jgi:ATP-dependent Clp protease ATP-binding subunit ClpC
VTLPRLDEQVRAILDASIARAGNRAGGGWSPLDVLATMVEAEDRRRNGFLAGLGADVPGLRHRLDKLSVPDAGPGPAELIDLTIEEAALGRAAEAGVVHLLLAVHETDGAAAIMNEFGITPDTLLRRAERLRRRAGRPAPQTTPNLNAFGTDLTEKAERGELDPVIGREAEMDRLMQVLMRRLKNNPILVGYAGVGKSAIVEGLAQRIAGRRVPEPMRGRRIVALDIAGLVSGARVRGQFEERLQGIMQEVERAQGDLILFVDEVHLIVGAGASEGGFDFASMIKPALARGAFRLIGATTADEYRRHIERDAALERRLSPVWVAEPSPAESLAIVHGLRPRYEQHHDVAFDDDALAAAVRLSARYLPARRLPDKAIDLIDEAAARAVLARGTMPDDLSLLEAQRSERAVDRSDELQPPADRRARRRRLMQWLDGGGHRPAVSEEDIATLVAAMTGIPVARVQENEAARLLRLEERLRRRVVGQDQAVHTLAEAIRRARAGLSDPRRPIGSFIFLGPSGVGKTELARALAEALFDDPDALLRLDMSEYMERHNVARLFGAPPGYVGYDDAGTLTELVRRRPYRVVLFDEIEKAHPDVFQVLLQILDAGRMTDGHGHVVDFRNAVIILTSNLGTGDEADAARLVRRAGGNYDRAWLEAEVAQALQRVFRPEFRNRIDEILVFEPLSEQHLFEIIDLQLADVRATLALRGIALELTPAARKAVVQEGFSPVFGARPLRRTLQRRVIDPIANRLLRDEVQPGDRIIAGYRDGRLVLRVERPRDTAPSRRHAATTPHAPAADPAVASAGAVSQPPARPRPATAASAQVADDFVAYLI